MADLAVGLTGAELANALNEAAIMAVSEVTLSLDCISNAVKPCEAAHECLSLCL